MKNPHFFSIFVASTTEVEVLSLPLRSPFTGDDAGCLGRLAAHCLGLGGQEREAQMEPRFVVLMRMNGDFT